LKHEAASGVVLLFAGALAFGLANSPWSVSYLRFWHWELGGQVAGFQLGRSLEWIVNDALMAIFFFQVGLEIRLEQSHGQLAEWRRAALPVAAALGGMLVPALVYLGFAGAPATHSGWGVPMATDIAFALGVLALLGKRSPASLRVLLLAVAVIDDLGAILVILFFYSEGVTLAPLPVALAALAVVWGLGRRGVDNKLAYLPPIFVAWLATYSASIHPTIAGVAAGLLMPVTGRAAGRASLADELVHALHPWVNFAIMPIFALANAGVALGSAEVQGEGSHVLLGCALGLLIGKPVGVWVASFAALRLGIARVPEGLRPRHMVVLGVLTGIGFTMALFIAKLAFEDPELLAAAKLGVLAASVLAGVVAYAAGRVLLRGSASVA
jgi:NhaA family Na+:H+ antiporter